MKENKNTFPLFDQVLYLILKNSLNQNCCKLKEYDRLCIEYSKSTSDRLHFSKKSFVNLIGSNLIKSYFLRIRFSIIPCSVL